jgi:hypothetical protein
LTILTKHANITINITTVHTQKPHPARYCNFFRFTRNWRHEMNSNNNSPFWYFSLYNNPIPEIKFSESALIKPEVIKVRIWGVHRLRVPQNVWGVIIDPFGSAMVYRAGFHRIPLLPGSYELYYVDAQHRVIDLNNVVERAHDNWKVKIEVKVLCQVTAPAEVILVQQPMEQFATACEAGIKDYIRSKSHDSLVPTLGEGTVIRSQVGIDLKNIIETLQPVKGLDVLKVVVQNIVGDSDRLEAIDKANLERTELREQNTLIEDRRKNEIEKIKTERLAAEEHMEQKLRQADIDSQVADKLFQSQYQQVQLSLFKGNQEIQKEKIRVMGKVFESMTEVMMRYQMQGVTRNGDSTSLEALAHSMGSLVKSLDATSALDMKHLSENVTTKQISLFEALANELENVSELPIVEDIRLHKNGKSHIDAVVRLPGIELTICCSDDYPQKGPTKINIVNDNQRRGEMKEIEWNGKNKLSDVVNHFTHQLSAGKVRFHGHVSDNDLPLAR